MSPTQRLSLRTTDANLDKASERLQEAIHRLFRRSMHLRHIDTGSCDACESEIKQMTSPYYDLHRLGIFFTTSPRHADLLLVTGPLTSAMRAPLRRTYEAMPDPKLVVAVGACACTGGIFPLSGFTEGGIEDALPVDVFIPGCPPSPFALIQGLLLAIDRVEQRMQSGQIQIRNDPNRRNSSNSPTLSAK